MDPRPAQHNLAGVLDGQNVAARDTRRSSLRRSRTQGSYSHCRIAQKPTKAYLASPLAARQYQDTAARMSNQRRMTPGPLFSSRKSPNPPTENRLTSMSLMPIQTSQANQRSGNQFFGANSRRSEMCASDSDKAGAVENRSGRDSISSYKMQQRRLSRG
jgi:hypothetical protein